jgi:hypothetical protein
VSASISSEPCGARRDSPGNTVIAEQERAIWQLVGGDSDVRLFDGGADGVAQTTGDNTLFAASGVFFP